MAKHPYRHPLRPLAGDLWIPRQKPRGMTGFSVCHLPFAVYSFFSFFGGAPMAPRARAAAARTAGSCSPATMSVSHLTVFFWPILPITSTAFALAPLPQVNWELANASLKSLGVL